MKLHFRPVLAESDLQNVLSPSDYARVGYSIHLFLFVHNISHGLGELKRYKYSGTLCFEPICFPGAPMTLERAHPCSGLQRDCVQLIVPLIVLYARRIRRLLLSLGAGRRLPFGTQSRINYRSRGGGVGFDNEMCFVSVGVEVMTSEKHTVMDANG